MKILSILNENPEKYGFDSEKFKASQNERRVLSRIGMKRGYKTEITTSRGDTKRVQVTGVGTIEKGMPQIQVRMLDGDQKNQEFAIPFSTFKAEYAKYKGKLEAKRSGKQSPEEGTQQEPELDKQVMKDITEFVQRSDKHKRYLMDILNREYMERRKQQREKEWSERT